MLLSILINDRQMDVSRFRRVSGCITQDDALFPLLIVKECFTYSTWLRLRATSSDSATQVRELIRELGLAHVASLRIGGGISDGERRRVGVHWRRIGAQPHRAGARRAQLHIVTCSPTPPFPLPLPRSRPPPLPRSRSCSDRAPRPPRTHTHTHADPAPTTTHTRMDPAPPSPSPAPPTTHARTDPAPPFPIGRSPLPSDPTPTTPFPVSPSATPCPFVSSFLPFCPFVPTMDLETRKAMIGCRRRRRGLDLKRRKATVNTVIRGRAEALDRRGRQRRDGKRVGDGDTKYFGNTLKKMATLSATSS